MSPETSVTVIGEALMDLVVQYGDKVEDAVAVPGGSSANVALALGRLGYPVDLVTWIAKDGFGEQIREHLDRSKVRISEISFGALRTPTGIAYLDENNAASYVFDFEFAPPAPIVIPDSTAVLLIGSISAVADSGSESVLEAVKSAQGHALICYDPNIRPQLMTDKNDVRKKIEALAARADLVKASDEDLAWLYPGVQPEDSALRWVRDFDIPFLVLTRGKEGPKAWLGTDVCRSVTPADVKVVDTVGAGDTFMSGLIDSLWRRGVCGADSREKLRQLDGDDLETILDEASTLADIVVQRRGADPAWAHELGR